MPLVVSYDKNERVYNPPMPLLFQWRRRLENRPVAETSLRKYLDHALTALGIKDAGGQPMRYTFHDFRRLFITDAIMHGMPPHIAQLVAGHRDINTTMGYKAVYPEEVINGHRAFIARRRALRPSEEYRTPTDEEWAEFIGHFEHRKVSIGDCGRSYDTPCIHEHSCLRCPLLRPDPAARPRLVQIRDNLIARIAEAESHRWLGEAEGLKVSLAGARAKLAQMDQITARRSQTVHLGIPTFTDAAGRTSTNPPAPTILTSATSTTRPDTTRSFASSENDVRDAADLADLLRMGRLPEAWIAPPAVRELRELVRHRAKLVMVRSGFKAGVHAVLAKQGLHLPVTDLFGPRGRAELAAAPLDRALPGPAERLPADRRHPRHRDRPDGRRVDRRPPRQRPGVSGDPADPGDRAGAGRRCSSPRSATSPGSPRRGTCARWAGLTPRHRESDTTVHRGPITKQGSTLVRWAAVEAVQRIPAIGRLAGRHPRRRSPNAAAATSPPSRSPAACSPWSTTACATATSAPSHPDPRRTRTRGRHDLRSVIGRVVAAESGSRQLAASRGLD